MSDKPSSGMPQSLFGVPIVYNESANIGFNPGDIVFADPAETYTVKTGLVVERVGGVYFLTSQGSDIRVPLTLTMWNEQYVLLSEDGHIRVWIEIEGL